MDSGGESDIVHVTELATSVLELKGRLTSLLKLFKIVQDIGLYVTLFVVWILRLSAFQCK